MKIVEDEFAKLVLTMNLQGYPIAAQRLKQTRCTAEVQIVQTERKALALVLGL